MSSKELQTWGGVAKGFGGNADTIQNSLQNISGGLAKFRQGFGGEDITKALSFLRVKESDATNILKISAALIAFKKIHGVQEAKNIAELLGFDEAGYNMLLAGPEKLADLTAEYERLNHITPELTENSKKFDIAVAGLLQSLTGLRNESTNGVLPAVNELIDGMASAVASFADFDEETDGLTTKIAGLAGVFLLLGKAIKFLPIKGSGFVSKAFTTIGMGLGGGAATSAVVGASMGYDKAKAAKDLPSSGGTAEELIGIYQSLGLDREHAAAIVGNAMAESSLNPHNTKNATHRGMLQWSNDRQKNFEKFAGFDLNDARADLRKQAEFSIYEMKSGEEQKAGREFFAAQGVRNLAKIFNDSYERSNGSAEGYRQDMAEGYFGQNNMIGSQTNIPTNNTSNSSSNHTTLNGGINIHAPSGNASSISDSFKKTLSEMEITNNGVRTQK
jgi:hypothetical protein